MKEKKKIHQVTAIVGKEKKWFVAKAAELGVASQGRTVEEALRNLREAVELYLEREPKVQRFISHERPLLTTLEVTVR